MEEPFDQATARGFILRILEGPGMTVFTRRAKAELLENDMTSADAVNVVRGGLITKGILGASGWSYRAQTRRMVVEFSFRGHVPGSAAEPNELVLERGWRNHR